MHSALRALCRDAQIPPDMASSLWGEGGWFAAVGGWVTYLLSA